MIKLANEIFLVKRFQKFEELAYVRPGMIFAWGDNVPEVPVPGVKIAGYMKQNPCAGGGPGSPTLLRCWWLSQQVPLDGCIACNDPGIIDPKSITPKSLKVTSPQKFQGDFLDHVHKFCESYLMQWLGSPNERHALFHGYTIPPWKAPTFAPIFNFCRWPA